MFHSVSVMKEGREISYHSIIYNLSRMADLYNHQGAFANTGRIFRGRTLM